MTLRTISAVLAALSATLTTGVVLAAGPSTGAPPAPVGLDGSRARTTPYDVSLRTTDAEPRAGRAYVLKGRVRPAAPGQRVVLQKRYDADGPWKDDARTKLDRRSRFTFEMEDTAAGLREYRVVKAKDRRHARGVSDAVPVTVFTWRRVAALGARTATSLWPGTATIVGDPLKDSLLGELTATSGQRDYNLNRACTRLRATIGVDDDTEESATATVAIVADGAERYRKTFGLTQSEQVSLPLDGVFRLGFEYVVANPEATDPAKPTGAVAVIGTPEAYCSL